MHTPDQSISTTTPAALRRATLVVCAFTGATTLPWIWMSIGQFGGFAWGMFGFELVVLLGSVMTILVAIGKIKAAHCFPMAIACLIGTILVSVVFGIHVDARAVVGDNPSIAPWINRTILIRFAIIATLGLIATLDVYRRDTRSWGLIIKAILFLLPVVGTIGWIKSNGMPSIEDASGEPSPVRMILILLGGLGVGILFSIGGHLLIRSYELGLPEDLAEKSDPKIAKKPA